MSDREGLMRPLERMATHRYTLTQSDWVQLNALLAAGLELQDGPRREWLDALPPSCQHLRPVLEGLLADADAAAGEQTWAPGFIEQAAADALEAMQRDQPGARIGPWEIVRPLAEGGMGSVWLAKRCDGSHERVVALKLPRARWADADLGARLARERDILARLHHPHIALLYDAGATTAGRPYLALEYVSGRTIDRYCAESGVDVRRILELVIKVVRAVAYAHSRLVVHRDIKPTNVMVTDDGEPKLLDFGISKVLSGPSANEVAVTRLGQRPATLAYAAPEQLLGHEVTVATDVYALGGLLFELLTGRRAFCGASATELEQSILLGESPRPSRAVQDPARAKVLRGDLDAIVQKAMRREPALRYGSAVELAEDLERYLLGKPVRARAITAAYRLVRYVRRNRLPVALAACAAASLVIGASVALWQARAAQERADEAASLNSFLLGLIQQADPDAATQTLHADVSLLASLEAHLDEHYQSRPERALSLRLRLGEAYLNRRDGVAAQRVFQKGADLAAARLPPDDLQLLAAQVRAADPRLLVSRASSRRLEDALAQLRHSGRPGAALLVTALLTRFELGYHYGVPEYATLQQSLALLNEALEVAIREFGPGSPQHLGVVLHLARVLEAHRDRADAMRAADEALDAAKARKDGSDRSPEFAALRNRRLGFACFTTEAQGALQQLWVIADEASARHGPGSAQVEEALALMPECYLQLFDSTGAWVPEASARIAAERERPPSTTLLFRAERALFQAYDRRDLAAAERLLALAKQNGDAIVEEDLRSRRMRWVSMLEVCVLAESGRLDESLERAAPLRAELDEQFRRVGRATTIEYLLFKCQSFAERQLGRFAEARQTAQSFIDRCPASKYSADARCEAKLLLARAEAEVEAGEFEAALASLRERRRQPRGLGLLPDHPLAEGRALLGLGRVDEAIDRLRGAYGAWLASSAPAGANAAEAEYWLARAYLEKGDARGAWMLKQARSTLSRSPFPRHQQLAAGEVRIAKH
jgi:hypothetical protein